MNNAAVLVRAAYLGFVARPSELILTWCRDHLGSEPAEVLFHRHSISSVFGFRLASGSIVVVKSRPDDGRAESCVAAQALLSAQGFPCARPVTPVITVDSLAVHAEEFRPGGDMLRGDSPSVAVRYASVFARLMSALESVSVPPPLPNPRWIRWDHTDPGPWPSIDVLDSQDQRLVPAHVVDTALRARQRLLSSDLPCVLGHGDFEAQNLRWRGPDLWVVHDWDSLSWQPAAALVGAASGSFSSSGPPTLAPVAASEAFLSAYQHFRRRPFTPAELEVAWAASLWPAVHNARWEALHGDPPHCLSALLAQAPEEPSFRQVLVTTYEEPLIRRLRGSIPNTHLVYVRPSAA